jgi:hypothetical protein
VKTPKQLYLLKAGLYTALAAGAFIWIYFISDKAPAKLSKLEAASLASGVILVFAVIAFIRYLFTSPDDCFYDISKQPPDEQITVSRRVILIMFIVCPILTYMTHQDINAFESGKVDVLKAWKLIIFIYQNFGRDAAIAAWPTFGCVIAMICAARIKKAKLILLQLHEDELQRPNHN